MTGFLSLRGLLGVWGMTLSKFWDSSNLTCSGCSGTFLFRTFDKFVTLLGSTFDGEVGADHGSFAVYALVIRGKDKVLLNLADLDSSLWGLGNTSSSVESDSVSDSFSDVDVALVPSS